MPVNNPELELLGAIYSTISTAITGGSVIGLTLAGGTIAPGLYNQVSQDAVFPYIRITLTDTRLVDDEPYEYGGTAHAHRLMFMVDAFSDYEPCTFQLSGQLQALLHNLEITTTNFHGSSWLQSSDYF